MNATGSAGNVIPVVMRDQVVELLIGIAETLLEGGTMLLDSMGLRGQRG